MSKLPWILMALAACAGACPTQSNQADAAEPRRSPVSFARGDGQITIAIDGLPVAVYCYQHEEITRPFFAQVRALNGIKVTRHHPPIAGQDLTDHAALHPGIWMSFGDINGSDYWRLAAPVKHLEFVETPHLGNGVGSFAVRNHYLSQKDSGEIVCDELARYAFEVVPAGYLLRWDATFTSGKEFAFGDQEEMGLGVRMATPLRASSTGDAPPGVGVMLDAAGRKNEKEIWGHSSEWCDSSGVIAGQRVGIAIFCHPENFRPSWFHARDYGLMVANPFGRKAFGKGEASNVVVARGEKLRLRYGMLVYSSEVTHSLDLAEEYRNYVKGAKE